jgi:hypothetical protein
MLCFSGPSHIYSHVYVDGDRLCGQSSWLKIQTPRARFPAITDYLGSCRLEWGPVNLVKINDELLERKIKGSGLEN